MTFSKLQINPLISIRHPNSAINVAQNASCTPDMRERTFFHLMPKIEGWGTGGSMIKDSRCVLLLL